jgi:PAS domain S-box-containing protein
MSNSEHDSAEFTGHIDNSLFRIAVEASPTGIIIVDNHGTILVANAESCRIFGYAAEELLGGKIERLIPTRFRESHPALRDAYVPKATARIMGAGRTLSGLRKDGTEFSVEIGLRPVETIDGRRVILTVSDITTRTLEDELFRAAVEASPNGMIVVNAEGNIVIVNSEALRVFEYSREELINHPVEKLIPLRHRGVHKSLRDSYSQDPEARPMGAGRDLAGRRKDGSEFPLEIGLSPVKTRLGNCVIAAVTDLSARKAAAILRGQMAKSQAHLAAVVDSTDDAIISLDLGGQVKSWNFAAEKLFGYTSEEMLGKTMEITVPPELLAEQRSMLQLLQSGGSNVKQYETQRITKNGLLVNVSMTLSAIKNRQGQVVGISKLARDISERVRAAELLRKQSAELARSNNELQQFAYSASHDLQEPLRAITGCIELLRRQYHETLDARAHELISHAINNARYMRSLIDGLINLSRVGGESAMQEVVDCNEVIKLVIESLRASLVESSAQIEVHPLPVIRGNAIQLQQLFQNLIANALKFRREITPEVSIRCERQGKQWLFSVTDNGLGIESQFTTQIFGLFQRLHSRSKYSGTGIGLALCAKIVSSLNGRIWVESKFGSGSVFKFTVPVTIDSDIDSP